MLILIGNEKVTYKNEHRFKRNKSPFKELFTLINFAQNLLVYL